MDMPPVYMCVFLSHEHEQLKAKIVELKEQIRSLEETVAEKNLEQTGSCSVYCQTDIAVRRPPYPIEPERPPSSVHEEARLHRLINAQNELLKKYEHEAMRRREENQFRSSPPLELIQDYERRLTRCGKEKEQAIRRALSTEKQTKKIERQYEEMRKKMSIFDEGFFEEVNDLKFALQQATHLGREYEKTIQMLSARLGINYPVTDT